MLRSFRVPSSLSPVVLLAACLGGPVPTAPTPVTAPVESPAFIAAVRAGTRTQQGVPGPRYWQQWSTYRLEATLDSGDRRLTGRSTVRYTNHSPSALPEVAVHLYQNIHTRELAAGTTNTVTNGIELTRVAANGTALPRRSRDRLEPGWAVEGTVGWLRLPEPLAAGETLTLDFEWSFHVPIHDPRMGTDGQTWMFAYWYPQMAVYDDISGWQTDQYTGNAEFYMGYGDYDVALTIPAGWLLTATGTLVNGGEILSDSARARLARVRAGSVTRVANAADVGAARGTTAGQGGRLTWRWRASHVRDFSWGASPRWIWDATAAGVGDASGDGRPDTALVHAFYRPEALPWVNTARYGAHAMSYFSRYLFPYPYPHMSVLEGPADCGGMEYPMLTCIAQEASADSVALYSVTSHEIAHMWVPMAVGVDEKRHAWMDEGLTQFNEAQATRDIFGGRVDAERSSQENYVRLALAGGEQELMRHGDRFANYPAYAVAAYEKPSAILRALRGVLGEDVFNRGYRAFLVAWIEKHPQPEDFFNAFERAAGRDLDWFWRPWFYGTGTLDQAITAVRPSGDSLEIVIESRGDVAMPVRLAISRTGGNVERVVVPVEVWLPGIRTHTLRVAASPRPTAIEIDPEGIFPDVDRNNGRWRP